MVVGIVSFVSFVYAVLKWVIASQLSNSDPHDLHRKGLWVSAGDNEVL